jgi:hypothetical protein
LPGQGRARVRVRARVKVKVRVWVRVAVVAEPSSRSLSTLRARDVLPSMGSLFRSHARVTNCGVSRRW